MTPPFFEGFICTYLRSHQRGLACGSPCAPLWVRLVRSPSLKYGYADARMSRVLHKVATWKKFRRSCRRSMAAGDHAASPLRYPLGPMKRGRGCGERAIGFGVGAGDVRCASRDRDAISRRTAGDPPKPHVRTYPLQPNRSADRFGNFFSVEGVNIIKFFLVVQGVTQGRG